MNLKKVIITLVLILSLFSVSAYAKTMQFTMGDYNAKIDDGAITAYTMEVAPYTVEGRTMVPVRVVAETFGADVQYIHEESKVVITLGDKTISFIIGQAVATVNGETVALDVPSVETNGRTLIPILFLSQTLGFDVKYVGVTEQILITDEPAVIEISGAKISLADFNAAYDMYMIEYGDYYSEEEIVEATKLMMMNYAIYEFEANKWDIILPLELKEPVKGAVSEIDGIVPGHLDGIWANILEIENRGIEVGNFLYQIYQPDEVAAEKYYDDNYLAAKHILVSDEATAKNIMIKLNNGSDFDQLMNEYSKDPGLATSPDGYVFTTGEMVEEFENTTKNLEVGKVSGIVETAYGYHIIKRIALPTYSEAHYESIADAYANDAISKHFTDVAENGDLKMDVYTNEQLIELCK